MEKFSWSTLTIEIRSDVKKKLQHRAIDEDTTAARIASEAVANAFGYELKPVRQPYVYVPPDDDEDDDVQEAPVELASQIVAAEKLVNERARAVTSLKIAVDEPIGKKA